MIVINIKTNQLKGHYNWMFFCYFVTIRKKQILILYVFFFNFLLANIIARLTNILACLASSTALLANFCSASQFMSNNVGSQAKMLAIK